jgi:YVTN family beta-propeller protein
MRRATVGSIRLWGAAVLGVLALALAASVAQAQMPSPALLVLEKADNSLAVVDPTSLRVVTRTTAGPDPHEIVASPDGKFAYISNYGGLGSTLNTISVVDLVAGKPASPINLGALHSAHGLDFVGGKLYFTAETNKVIGRYDPVAQDVEWVMGTGQDRTHMVLVSESQDRIFASNVMSGTISIIEQVAAPSYGPPPGAAAGAPPPGGPPPGGPRKTWEVTNVRSGRGSEGFDVTPDGKQIWAANAQDGTVTIIDVASKKATETFHVLVNGNRLKITPDGQRVLVSGVPGANTSGADVTILDTATHKEIKQLNLGGFAAGILIPPGGSRAYIAVSSKDKVVVLDLKTLEVTGEVATGKGPDGLAWARRSE